MPRIEGLTEPTRAHSLATALANVARILLAKAETRKVKGNPLWALAGELERVADAFEDEIDAVLDGRIRSLTDPELSSGTVLFPTCVAHLVPVVNSADGACAAIAADSGERAAKRSGKLREHADRRVLDAEARPAAADRGGPWRPYPPCRAIAQIAADLRDMTDPGNPGELCAAARRLADLSRSAPEAVSVVAARAIDYGRKGRDGNRMRGGMHADVSGYGISFASAPSFLASVVHAADVDLSSVRQSASKSR
jgi:hypothetical protein